MFFSPRYIASLLGVGLFVQSLPLGAEVTLPSIISDHMVLQKSERVPIWGKADAGEEVKVSFNGKSETTKAGEDGKWQVVLNLDDAGPGPYEMVVQGKNRISISDVLVGEVWLATGQSNMEWTIQKIGNAEKEIQSSANNQLRQFTVTNKTSTQPLEVCEGTWIIASPETTGNFSAVGYHFGKALQHELKVPVGIVDSNWGGTPIEAWMNVSAFDKDPLLKKTKDESVDEFSGFAKRKEKYVQEFESWLKHSQREDTLPSNVAIFADKESSSHDWKTMPIEGTLAGDGLPEAGVIWIRKEVTPKPGAAGNNLNIDLDGSTRNFFETVYWNGQKIGGLDYKSFQGEGARRTYSIPGNLVKEGKNMLAIRLYAPHAAPVFPGSSSIRMANAPIVDGPWNVKVERFFPSDEKTTSVGRFLDTVEKGVVGETREAKYPESFKALPPPQSAPTQLFNAMINPLIPYAFRGAIWYQGESNAGRGWQYRVAFPLMISGWRELWGRGDFPFYFCQLANFMKKEDQPTESSWAEVRESQLLTLDVSNTGQAVLIDIGEEMDIHPRNKQDVGDRLARMALAKDYGKSVVYSGPVYAGMNVEGDKIRLTFKEIAAGLVAKVLPQTYAPKTGAEEVPLVLPVPDSELQGFAICGEDRKWVWAHAKIEGADVLVWSDSVPKPMAVRYAWANNPTCNLYNSEGLPASPFRTDDFPLTTQLK